MGGLLIGIAVTLVVTSVGNAADVRTPGARFVYELCDAALPGGNPPATHVIGAVYPSYQDCASPGGAVVLQQPQATSPGNSVSALELAVPATPGGFVESDTVTAFVRNLQPGALAAWAVTEGWPPPDGLDHTRSFPVRTGPSSCTLCEAGGSVVLEIACSEACQAGGGVGAHDVAATEVDPVPPVIGRVEGAFLSGATLRGHQLLTASASDVGGGLSVLEVLVNGAVAPGAVPGSCAAARVTNPSYVGIASYSPSPCPPELSGAWDLNTAEPPFHEGSNTVQVCASDFATIGAPSTTCSPSQSVTVDDSCTESPVAGGQNLAAEFKGSGGEAVTVPFEEPAEAVGELTAGSGAPVAGATICVETQVVGDPSAPQAVATATTDSNGTFTYDLPAGPNRHLIFGYRHDSFLVTKTLSFGSRVKPSIDLSQGRIKRGHTVGIVGALPGPGSAGRVVVLQASSLHGTRWLTFRRATTGPKGGFRASYRFGGTSGTTTYRIRALVPRQSGYPWEPGHSVPKRIKVFAGRKRPAGDKKPRGHRHRGAAPKDKATHPHGGIGA